MYSTTTDSSEVLLSNTNIPYEVMTIENIYTDEEIGFFINQIENRSDKERLFSDNRFKNGKVIDDKHSQMIFDRIRSHLPPNYQDREGNEWEFVKGCGYIFYSKFEEGEQFGIHTDTGSTYDEDNKMYSKFTVLTYLNDDFIGGNTQFFDSKLIPTISIIPKKNKTLLFDIDLFHKGEMIIQGVKYWIGTEIVCKRG